MGRKKKVSKGFLPSDQIKLLFATIKEKQISLKFLAEKIGVKKHTLYRHLLFENLSFQDTYIKLYDLLIVQEVAKSYEKPKQKTRFMEFGALQTLDESVWEMLKDEPDKILTI